MWILNLNVWPLNLIVPFHPFILRTSCCISNYWHCWSLPFWNSLLWLLGYYRIPHSSPYSSATFIRGSWCSPIQAQVQWVMTLWSRKVNKEFRVELKGDWIHCFGSVGKAACVAGGESKRARELGHWSLELGDRDERMEPFVRFGFHIKTNSLQDSVLTLDSLEWSINMTH